MTGISATTNFAALAAAGQGGLDLTAWQVDLTGPYFWLVLGAAIFLLTPLRLAGMRKWELALINAAFLAVVVEQGVWAVLACVAGVWFILGTLFSESPPRRIFVAIICLAVVAAIALAPVFSGFLHDALVSINAPVCKILDWDPVKDAGWMDTVAGSAAALGYSAACLLAFIMLASAVNRLAGRRGSTAIWLGLLVVFMLGLFVIHKMPALGRIEWLTRSGGVLGGLLGQANPILAGVGYSYVMLRMVEMVRAVLEKRSAPPDLPSMLNYLMPFHMLAAGPIQAWDDFCALPPAPAAPSAGQVLRACERIAWGLVKKFVLAYTLKKLFLTDFRADGWYIVFEANVFFFWLYLEFSALADIAVGVGRLIGFAAPENFNHPYLARSLINFWERWHISLSQWIRRNLFIPIQLWTMRKTDGRRPLACASMAFLVSFVLCGIWHGISVGFFLWGLAHAVGLMVTNIYRHWLTRRLGAAGVKKYMRDWRIRLLTTVITFEYVALSLIPVGLTMRAN
ncbi:MAG: hypothetical protein HZA50_04215 [Planctomycetes bacterium]|nr:hypothetical protein [Planctomycetota bacterium]